MLEALNYFCGNKSMGRRQELFSSNLYYSHYLDYLFCFLQYSFKIRRKNSLYFIIELSLMVN